MIFNILTILLTKFIYIMKTKLIYCTRKILFIFFILLAWTTSLYAQITREQADVIILDYIRSVVTPPYLLYVNSSLPSEDGIFLTTYNEENMKVKYACWAYYLNENPEISGPFRHRYLFVKENNGNLLEVITYNDLGPVDLTLWISVPLGIADLEKSDILIYPNPTTGQLQVQSSKFKVQSVEVFDIFGKKVSSYHLITSSSNLLIDISHLPADIYFVKIATETGIITKKIIKY